MQWKSGNFLESYWIYWLITEWGRLVYGYKFDIENNNIGVTHVIWNKNFNANNTNNRFNNTTNNENK